MRAQLDFERRGRLDLTVHDFDCAVQALLPLRGINHSAHAAAFELMGPQFTTMCLILTFAKVSDPARLVRNPGGYLRGLTRAFQEGSLNIMAGLIGLSERRAAEERRG
jgi:replication initiation protein RepC